MLLRSLCSLAAALLLTAPATAQTTVIDEGSFRLEIRGSAIGTETFTIRRTGTGANASVVAQSRIVLDTGERTRTAIQFNGDDLRPAGYQIEVTGNGQRNITGRATGSRFRATLVSPAGERMQEYLVDPGAVIIDDAIAHLHYFVARSVDGQRSLPVIVPRRNAQVTARVEDRGTSTIRIAGQQVSARELAVDVDGMDPRTLWVDGRDRVLRLRIPAQDYVATRTSLP